MGSLGQTSGLHLRPLVFIALVTALSLPGTSAVSSQGDAGQVTPICRADPPGDVVPDRLFRKADIISVCVSYGTNLVVTVEPAQPSDPTSDPLWVDSRPPLILTTFIEARQDVLSRGGAGEGDPGNITYDYAYQQELGGIAVTGHSNSSPRVLCDGTGRWDGRRFIKSIPAACIGAPRRVDVQALLHLDDRTPSPLVGDFAPVPSGLLTVSREVPIDLPTTTDPSGSQCVVDRQDDAQSSGYTGPHPLSDLVSVCAIYDSVLVVYIEALQPSDSESDAIWTQNVLRDAPGGKQVIDRRHTRITIGIDTDGDDVEEFTASYAYDTARRDVRVVLNRAGRSTEIVGEGAGGFSGRRWITSIAAGCLGTPAVLRLRAELTIDEGSLESFGDRVPDQPGYVTVPRFDDSFSLPCPALITDAPTDVNSGPIANDRPKSSKRGIPGVKGLKQALGGVFQSGKEMANGTVHIITNPTQLVKVPLALYNDYGGGPTGALVAVNHFNPILHALESGQDCIDAYHAGDAHAMGHRCTNLLADSAGVVPMPMAGVTLGRRAVPDEVGALGRLSRLPDMVIDDAQFGQKVGKHAEDYGLNPADPNAARLDPVAHRRDPISARRDSRRAMESKSWWGGGLPILPPG